MRLSLALMVLIVAPLAAQKKACAVDSAGHSDVFTLEYSVRAFRGDDTLPDLALTRALGGALRGHFAAPPSIGELFYPNTYRPNSAHPGRFSTVFGTLRFDLASNGALTSEGWFAPSFDVATDRAIEMAIDSAVAAGEIRDVGVLIDTPMPQRIRLQFLAANDSGVRAPLVRLRVPMLRIDGGGESAGPSGPFPAEMLRATLKERTEFSMLIDTKGHPQQKSVQLIYAKSPEIAGNALAIFAARAFAPFMVGKCAVEYRMPVMFGK